MSTDKISHNADKGQSYTPDEVSERLYDLFVKERRSFREVADRMEMSPSTVREWAIGLGWYNPVSGEITVDEAISERAPKRQIASAVRALREQGRTHVKSSEIADETRDQTASQVGWYLHDDEFRNELDISLWSANEINIFEIHDALQEVSG